MLNKKRDELGRRVREVWIEWARRQPSQKPSWLVPYDELSEADKEADRCIGSALWGDFVSEFTEVIAYSELLTKFAGDAATLDYGENCTLQWISIVTANARAVIAKAKGLTP